MYTLKSLALAVSTREYTTALLLAPFLVSENNQDFLPTTNGLIAFSLRNPHMRIT